MKNYFKIIVAAFIILFSTNCAAQKAKYVFLFIGDGMGTAHVSITETYLANARGEIGMDPLCFTSFPVLGQASTYSASSQVTCSSAAGTALATGFKTKNYMLGMAPDSTTRLKSIAYKIHEAGYSVGVTSTVQINHATPAAFYGHNVLRSAYYEIGQEIPLTGFEFFAGGGILNPTGKKGENLKSLYDIIAESGYTVATSYEDFQVKKNQVKDHILMVQKPNSQDILPYNIGHSDTAMTHKQIVSAAVEILERNKKGFFLMSEGGEIDWTAHSNDLAGTVMEILGFDEAIQVAYEFYKKHPKQTLIVVTADHNTGGPALGKKGTKLNLAPIGKVTSTNTTTSVDEYMSNSAIKDSLNVECNIGWNTRSHTSDPVPVWAIGAGSEQFAGRLDNTDIPKKICTAMGIKF